MTLHDILTTSHDISWHHVTWPQDISWHHVTCLLSLHTIIKNLDIEEVHGNMVVEICIFTSWGNMHILSNIFPDSSSTSGFSMIAWWIWMSHDVMKCHEMELNVIRFDQMSGNVIDCEFITMVTERNQTSHHSTSHHIKSHAWANLVLHLFVSAERRCLRLSSLRYRCSTRIALSSDLMWCDVEWCDLMLVEMIVRWS